MDYCFSNQGENIIISVEPHQETSMIVDQLIKLRKDVGMTQQNIADMTGMARANIARVESKKNIASLDVLMRYAACLGYDVSLVLNKRET